MNNPTQPRTEIQRLICTIRIIILVAAIGAGVGAATCALDIPHPHLWGRWHPLGEDNSSIVAAGIEQRQCIICGATERQLIGTK